MQSLLAGIMWRVNRSRCGLKLESGELFHMVAHSTQCPLFFCVCFLIAWQPVIKTKNTHLCKHKRQLYMYLCFSNQIWSPFLVFQRNHEYIIAIMGKCVIFLPWRRLISHLLMFVKCLMSSVPSCALGKMQTRGRVHRPHAGSYSVIKLCTMTFAGWLL